MTSSEKHSALPKRSLAARSLRAGGWNLVTTLSSYALRLISNLIMTRLLMPEAFGMIAMAAVVLTALNLLTDIGVGRSIIREKDGADPHFLRVAWVVKFIRSSVIAAGVLIAALALWFLGPVYAPADSVYARPEMPGLIALAALSPLLAGASSTNLEITTRDMNYQKVTLFGIFSQIFSTICMVIFAQFSPTVWALMAGMLVTNFLLFGFSHTMLPGPRMRIEWNKEIADRLWHFGKWIMASSALGFVARNADKLILGGLIGSTTFGIYVIAQIWVDAGKSLVSQMGNRVGFPAIAEVIRERPDELPRLFRKFQTAIDVMCLLAFLGLFAGGRFLVETIYTDQYHLAGVYLQIMSLSFLIIRFETLLGLVLNLGNSKAMLGASAIGAVSIVVMVPAGFMALGVQGAIFGAVLSPLAVVPYTLFLTRKILGAKQTRIDELWFAATITVSAMMMFMQSAAPQT